MRLSSIEILRISRLDLSAMPAWICPKCPPAFPSWPSYMEPGMSMISFAHSQWPIWAYIVKKSFTIWSEGNIKELCGIACKSIAQIWLRAFSLVSQLPATSILWWEWLKFVMRVIESWQCSGHHLDEGLRVGISSCQLVVNHKSLCNDVNNILILFLFDRWILQIP